MLKSDVTTLIKSPIDIFVNQKIIAKHFIKYIIDLMNFDTYINQCIGNYFIAFGLDNPS